MFYKENLQLWSRENLALLGHETHFVNNVPLKFPFNQSFSIYLNKFSLNMFSTKVGGAGKSVFFRFPRHAASYTRAIPLAAASPLPTIISLQLSVVRPQSLVFSYQLGASWASAEGRRHDPAAAGIRGTVLHIIGKYAHVDQAIVNDQRLPQDLIGFKPQFFSQSGRVEL